jgi:stage IV sporulation protein FB
MFKIKINPFLYFLFFLAGITGEITTLVFSFCSVLLHETAHIVTAFGFGYQTFSIELFPFGGVARMEASLFNDPVAEAVTALAGPLESMILAFLLSTAASLLHLPALAEDLARINLGLGIFNLLPLYPLDGGRVLLSFFAHRHGYKKATQKIMAWTRGIALIIVVPLSWLALKKTIPFHLPILFLSLLVSVRQNNYFYSYWVQQTRKTTLLAEEGLLPSQVWVVETQRKVGEVLPLLTGKNYHLFFLIDKHGKILGEVTEEQLISMINQDNMFNLNIEQIWGHGNKRPVGGNTD